MNIEAIQTFVETVQGGSFAAVARARGVAPSSVSRVIADLEEDLQVRLFQRTTRRLSLTEAGQGYLDRVAPLLEELQRAREHARELGSTPKGSLRVAVSGTFAQVHLSRWLPRFLALYPDLKVELLLDQRYSDLVSERIDVAIRLGRVESSSVIAKKLCDLPRAIVASPRLLAGRTITPEVLGREPCVLFPHEGFSPVWKLRDRKKGKVIEVAPRARVIAADGLLLRALALEGEGFALLARWICAEELAAGTLVDVFPRHDVTATELDAAIWLLYASRSYLPLKVRAFVDFMSDLFRSGPPWEKPLR